MMAHEQTAADAAILTTRLPDWQQVPGLEYGALISRSGGAWRYVRPEGGATWGLARETPASDELPGDGDPSAILEAVAAELASGADDGIISFRTDQTRAEQVAAVVALVDTLYITGGEVFGFMVEPWQPGGWRDGLLSIAEYLEADTDALRSQKPLSSVRDLVEADTAAGMLFYRLKDEGRAGDALQVEKIRQRAAGALYAPAFVQAAGGAA